MPFNELDNYLKGLVSRNKIPGFVCWVGNLSTSFFLSAHGHARITPRETPMTGETVFDLASLTKPLATALSIMILHERELLNIDDALQNILPWFKGTPYAEKTVRQLLTHTSGLPAWHPTYLLPEKEGIAHLAMLRTPGKEPVYSCLGYIVLGRIVEQVSGMSLDIFLQQNITRDMELQTLGFGPVIDKKTVAATEAGNNHERKMASRYGDACGVKWREYVIQGEVHDGNAYYGFGGVAGNAGLFSNLSDLITLTRAYLNAEVLNNGTLSMMTRECVGSTEKRNLGWRVDPFPGSLSPESFGHTGFTGTMLVIDPHTNLIIILLTNAIHPTVKVGIMQPIRRHVVKIVSDAMKLSTARS
jgi:CubicO group peptidase (beta-lactamase class C family)